MKENTGNYIVCRHKIGVGNSIEVLFEFNDRKSAIAKKKEIDKDAIWVYYCEEEVIYKGTQKDQNNNPINSAPSWVRI